MQNNGIYIDGVDVKGCKYFGGHGQECSSEDLGMCSCDEHPDCLYKQLQAEKQKAMELEQKNNELTILGMDLDIAHRTVLKGFQETDKSRDYWREHAEKYKQALEEIKELTKNAKKDLCNSCGWYETDSCTPEDYTCGEFIKILQKCEVLND